MVTTVRTEPRRALRHISTWAQAVGLVYVIGFGMVLLSAAVASLMTLLLALLLVLAPLPLLLLLPAAPRYRLMR